MKTIFIPKGETRTFEELSTEKLIVDGHLKVTGSIKAEFISGRGAISAEEVSADSISVAELDTATTICRRLMAKRVTTSELFASDWAVVSVFLSAGFVETGKLTMALSDVDEVKANEVITLKPAERGMFTMLIHSALRSFWLRFTAPAAPVVDAEYEPIKTDDAQETPAGGADDTTGDPEIKAMIAEAMKSYLDEVNGQDNVNEEAGAEEDDFELKRIVSMFKLLRESGYTLRLVPGTPEENAPVFGFGETDTLSAAA